MTMFSMKPKFNLAEFIADSEPPKGRKAKPASRGKRRSVKAAAPVAPVPPVDAAKKDAPEV